MKNDNIIKNDNDIYWYGYCAVGVALAKELKRIRKREKRLSLVRKIRKYAVLNTDFDRGWIAACDKMIEVLSHTNPIRRPSSFFYKNKKLNC